jgi:hypothetical protein
MDDIQTVEITKRPGQSLGFYIREGNGRDRTDGVFISRLAVGGVVDLNGLLHVGDEIVSVNTLPVSGRRLEDVVISMSVARRLVLTVRPASVAVTSVRSETNSSSSLSALAAADDEDSSSANPVVILRGGFRNQGQGHSQSQTDAGFAYPPDSADALERSRQWNNSVSGDGHRTAGRSGMRYPGLDDSGDSGLSSDNSGFYKMNSAGPVAWSADGQQLQQLSMSTFQPSPTSAVVGPSGLRAQHPGYFSDSETEYSPASRHMMAAGRHVTPGGPRTATWQGAQQTPEWVERFFINGAGAGAGAGIGAGRVRQSLYCAGPSDYSTLSCLGTRTSAAGGQVNGIKFGLNPDEVDGGMKNDSRRLSARDR